MWDDGSGVVLKAEGTAKEELEQRKAEQKEEVRQVLQYSTSFRLFLCHTATTEPPINVHHGIAYSDTDPTNHRLYIRVVALPSLLFVSCFWWHDEEKKTARKEKETLTHFWVGRELICSIE